MLQVPGRSKALFLSTLSKAFVFVHFAPEVPFFVRGFVLVMIAPKALFCKRLPPRSNSRIQELNLMGSAQKAFFLMAKIEPFAGTCQKALFLGKNKAFRGHAAKGAVLGQK